MFRTLRPILFAMLVAPFLTGCIAIIPLFPSTPGLREVTVRPATQAFSGKVLMIDISGTITSTGSGGLFGSPNVLAEVDEQLLMAADDSSIKAVVLRINSPGGGVTATDMLYRQIQKFKEKTKLPIYVSMMDMAASGGYYLAMTADKVYATPTSITGSIGVIAIFPEGEGLMDKIGVEVTVVKSGKMKDMGSFFRKMNSEDQKLLQALIDDMYGKFVDVVAKGRPNLPREKIKELADGRIYTATQAKEAGLIDDLAYLDEVIDKAEEAGGTSGARVVMYRRSSSYESSLYATAADLNADMESKSTASGRQQPSTQVNLVNVGGQTGDMLNGALFQYRFVP